MEKHDKCNQVGSRMLITIDKYMQFHIKDFYHSIMEIFSHQPIQFAKKLSTYSNNIFQLGTSQVRNKIQFLRKFWVSCMYLSHAVVKNVRFEC